jgi:hypothetical protein
VPATCLCPKPAQSSPYIHILPLEGPPYYYPSIYAWVFPVGSFPRVSPPKMTGILRKFMKVSRWILLEWEMHQIKDAVKIVAHITLGWLFYDVWFFHYFYGSVLYHCIYVCMFYVLLFKFFNCVFLVLFYVFCCCVMYFIGMIRVLLLA